MCEGVCMCVCVCVVCVCVCECMCVCVCECECECVCACLSPWVGWMDDWGGGCLGLGFLWKAGCFTLINNKRKHIPSNTHRRTDSRIHTVSFSPTNASSCSLFLVR